MKQALSTCILLIFSILTHAQSQKINRKAVVQRHSVVLTKADTLASLSVGNGSFCFTADITGLQTFPDEYAKGIPLGTQSEWGWHSFPNTEVYKIEESLKDYDTHGRKVPYGVQANSSERNKLAVNYLRQNPHRLQLGNLGFDLSKKDGSAVKLEDINDIHQTLDMWTGELKSHFSIENETVDVSTFCHQERDVISVKVKSKLLKTGQIKIRLRFPYPTDKFLDEGNNWGNAEKHISKIANPIVILGSNSQNNQRDFRSNDALIEHILDTTSYYVGLKWEKKGVVIKEMRKHCFQITPSVSNNKLELNIYFTNDIFKNENRAKGGPFPNLKIFNFNETKQNSLHAWQAFWRSGAAIDFSETKDKQAFELERRIILSQYLTKIQCTGAMPPQETGLTYNSWFGKPHLEMHWWHAAHFAQWGRAELMEKSLSWYKKTENEARNIAQRQGFEGVRWQKMTDPDGREAPSSVGAFLIWQQPHFIYFAEQAYQAHSDKKTLEEYKDLVFKTANFMASYVYFDPIKQRYILGTGLIPAQERFKPEDTFNPTYELAYWHWALTIAQKWRERLGLKINEKYANVLQKLSPLPVLDGVYLATESALDSYINEKFLTDHPSVLGTFGMLPETPLLDKTTMKKTFDKVWKIWHWDDTWGWDFPMTAMTATRLGMPEKAVEALLMPIRTNTYLLNGHNYQDARLRLYLPGNGGLLSAVALMCTNSGFPKSWKVRWEGMKKML
jgi:protein-glucosylgalactosylhydroxylysine glucosidase